MDLASNRSALSFAPLQMSPMHQLGQPQLISRFSMHCSFESHSSSARRARHSCVLSIPSPNHAAVNSIQLSLHHGPRAVCPYLHASALASPNLHAQGWDDVLIFLASLSCRITCLFSHLPLCGSQLTACGDGWEAGWSIGKSEVTKECQIGPRYSPTWFSAQEGYCRRNHKAQEYIGLARPRDITPAQWEAVPPHGRRKRWNDDLGTETGVRSIPTRRINSDDRLTSANRWLGGLAATLCMAGTCIGRAWCDNTKQNSGAVPIACHLTTRWWHGIAGTPRFTPCWWHAAVHALQLRPYRWREVTVPRHDSTLGLAHVRAH
jgi:hypothetical protein